MAVAISHLLDEQWKMVPNVQSAQFPLFGKPFELDYLMTNYFDHQLKIRGFKL